MLSSETETGILLVLLNYLVFAYLFRHPLCNTADDKDPSPW